MKSAALRIIRDVTHRLGFEIVPYGADFDRTSLETIQRTRPFTMTSASRVFALCEAVRYVCDNTVPGDIVECGVWRGGSMMAAARTLMECGDTSRSLYLYDTFEGMPPPGARDRARTSDRSAADILKADRKDEGSLYWAYSPLETVRNNLLRTNYPADRMRFIKGKVEQTLPASLPERIAILRLDTDWYESTLHELTHLYPRLSHNGVLIIDDYGYWQGARAAVDEFFRAQSFRPMLVRVDSTARVAIKP